MSRANNDFMDFLRAMICGTAKTCWATTIRVAKGSVRLTKKNSHKHRCYSCGFIWRHHNDRAGDHEAHICVCGNEVWARYHGNKRANYVGCEKPVKFTVNNQPVNFIEKE